MLLQQGAGRLYLAPARSPEPNDLTSPWHTSWTYLGETKGGVEFVSNDSIGTQYVMESYAPIGMDRGDNVTTVAFSLASVTAKNLAVATAGVASGGGTNLSTFSPGALQTFWALGWESDEGTERWVYRKCFPTGDLSIVRSKSDSAVIPVLFTVFADYTGQPLWTTITEDE